jgi:8-oxo-dGTP pyrophosphatase MutT (NUDIX family)
MIGRDRKGNKLSLLGGKRLKSPVENDSVLTACREFYEETGVYIYVYIMYIYIHMCIHICIYMYIYKVEL